jgi:hypothetical protein
LAKKKGIKKSSKPMLELSQLSQTKKFQLKNLGPNLKD